MSDSSAGTTSHVETEMLLEGADAFADMLEGQTLPDDQEDAAEMTRLRSQFSEMNNQRKEEFLCDITLLVGPEKIPIKAHKIVLTSFSEYFKSMLSGSMAESTQKEIHLPSLDAETMNIILDYMYGENIDLDVENIHRIIVAAGFFRSDSLVTKCSELMAEAISSENCVKMLIFAGHYNLAELKERAKSYLVDNLEKVYKSNVDFTRLSVKLMIEIAEDPKAVLVDGDHAENEKQLFVMLMQKISVLEEEDQDQYIPAILKAVRLPFVDEKYLNYIEKKVEHIKEAQEYVQSARGAAERFKQLWIMNNADIPFIDGMRSKSTFNLKLTTDLAALRAGRCPHTPMVQMQGHKVLMLLSLEPTGFYVKIVHENPCKVAGRYTLRDTGGLEMVGLLDILLGSDRHFTWTSGFIPRQHFEDFVPDGEIQVEVTGVAKIRGPRQPATFVPN